MVYKIAIIGHGSAGDLHRRAIEEAVPELEVIAIVDPRLQNPEQMDFPVPKQKDYGRYYNLESFLQTGLYFDAVIIATPTNLHLQNVKKLTSLTQTKKTLLVEKPLGRTYHEAEQINNFILEEDIKCMAGLTGRFHPEFLAAYHSLQNDDIGKIISMQERIHFGFPGKFLRTYLAEHGNRGVAMEDGIHTFDRIHFFSGSKIVRLEGFYKSNEHFGELAEDYAIGIAVTESGLHVPFSQRFTQDNEEDYVFQMTGTKGTIKVEGFKKSVLIKGNHELTLYEHDLSKSFRERHLPGFKNELAHFVKYLQGKTEQNYLREALEAQGAVELQYS